jgi:uncharacterized protein YbjT (DUF2867 family)
MHMTNPADWLPYLRGIDAVINSVGIIGETRQQRFAELHRKAPIALFQACAEAGIRRVIQISALGADETAFSAYHLSKRAADDTLRALDLDWFVLRPSLIYGRGGGSAVLFLRLARLPLLPLIGDGTQALQPVHIVDVVSCILRALETSTPRQSIDIVGPETISFAEWLARMRSAQGLGPARRLHLPPQLAKASFRFLRHIHPLLQPDNLRMLLASYHADPAPLADFLGRSALNFSPELFFLDAPEALSWTMH